MVFAVLLLVSLLMPVLLATALLLLLVLGVVLLLVRGRRQHYQQRQLLAQAQEAAQQQALAAALVAQEDERQRIAGELHDGVGTILALARLHLFAAGTPLLPEVVALIDQSITEVRRISRNLQPATLQQLGLVPALRALAQAVPLGSGPAVRIAAPPLPGRLAPAHELMVYRIAQELLSNGLRHAQARHIVLEITPSATHLLLIYTDDGTGFDLPALDEQPAPSPRNHPAGMGLINLRSRVAVLGGQLRYESAPTQGTRVVAELPVEYRPADDGE